MIDCDNDKVEVTIGYSEYNDNWFGIVFSDSMIGNALVYTTGTTEELEESLYPYDIEGRYTDDIILGDQDEWWTQESVDESDGTIVVKYSQSLDNTPIFSRETLAVKMRWAYGDTLKLAQHSTDQRSDDTVTFNFAPATGVGCDDSNYKGSATTTFDGFDITITINCVTNKVEVTIGYPDYSDNWFGIVFAETMIGDALVYTTGLSGDLDEALYPYDLTSKSSSGVDLGGEAWTEEEIDESDGGITIKYSQDLDKTSIFSRDTLTVDMRWAYGDSLKLEYHGSDQRSSAFVTLDLETGDVDITEDDRTLEITHGVIMWFAWAILASIGIFASAFRWIGDKENDPTWFKVHRGVQATVVILDLVGFVIAIVFTIQKDNPHFDNAHMIIGLVVTILSVLQPINAWFRPHPPFPDGKPTGRIVWEWIHKGFGYITWILANVAIMLGLLILGGDTNTTLAYLHMFLWCGILLIVYVVLKIIQCVRDRQSDEIGGANDEPQGGGGNVTTR